MVCQAARHSHSSLGSRSFYQFEGEHPGHEGELGNPEEHSVNRIRHPESRPKHRGVVQGQSQKTEKVKVAYISNFEKAASEFHFTQGENVMLFPFGAEIGGHPPIKLDQ